MEMGLKTAILVPLNVAKTANQVWGPLKELANLYNVTTKSDLQVAARSIETGVWGAYYNLMINLKSMDDEEFKVSSPVFISAALIPYFKIRSGQRTLCSSSNAFKYFCAENMLILSPFKRDTTCFTKGQSSIRF